MDNHSSYEEVMREVDEINDMLENAKREELEETNPSFKWEYAFESLTELNTFYRKRISNV